MDCGRLTFIQLFTDQVRFTLYQASFDLCFITAIPRDTRFDTHRLYRFCLQERMRAQSGRRAGVGYLFKSNRITRKDFYEYRWLTTGPQRFTAVSRCCPEADAGQKRSGMADRHDGQQLCTVL